MKENKGKLYIQQADLTMLLAKAVQEANEKRDSKKLKCNQLEKEILQLMKLNEKYTPQEIHRKHIQCSKQEINRTLSNMPNLCCTKVEGQAYYHRLA